MTARQVSEKEIKALARLFVTKYLKKTPAAEDYKDDLYSEAMQGVWRAYQTYDSSKGSFSYYAFQWCNARCIRFLQRYASAVKGRNASASVDSLDEVSTNSEGGDGTSLLETLAADEPLADEESERNALIKLFPLIKAKAEELAALDKSPGYGTLGSCVNIYYQIVKGHQFKEIEAVTGLTRYQIPKRAQQGERYFRRAVLLIDKSGLDEKTAALYQRKQLKVEGWLHAKPYRKPEQLPLF